MKYNAYTKEEMTNDKSMRIICWSWRI